MTDYNKVLGAVEKAEEFDPAETIRWAIQTIRELDEVGRSMIPGFDPMDSDDMGRLKELEKIAEEFDR